MMLLLAVGAALITAYLIFRMLQPLLERQVVTAEDFASLEDEASDLLNRRDRLVEELRDLEFEAALNKIDGRDLTDLRTRYEAEAVEVVRRLDERLESYQARIDRESVGKKKTEEAP